MKKTGGLPLIRTQQERQIQYLMQLADAQNAAIQACINVIGENSDTMKESKSLETIKQIHGRIAKKPKEQNKDGNKAGKDLVS